MWFLLKLRDSSIATSKLLMRDFLISVVADIDNFYRRSADQLLGLRPENLPSVSSSSLRQRLTRRWQEAAKGFFILDLNVEGERNLRFFTKKLEEVKLAEESPEFRAIKLASARWVLAHQQPGSVSRSRLVVDERDENNRIILRPILNKDSHVVAIAGIIVDSDYFEKQFLPTVLERQLKQFFPNAAEDNIIITVRDGAERLLYGSQPSEGQGDEITRTSSFLFTDWSVSVQSRHITPEQWARRSFYLNLSLAGVLGVIAVGGIIFTMKSAVRTMKLSEMKTEFVANVSHELRTPLSSIQVLGEFLAEGRVNDPDKIRQYGEYIEGESQRLRLLIDDILDFAKLESGNKTYHFEPVDPVKTIEEILETAEIGLEHKGISIHCDCFAAYGELAMLDKDAVTEAILNLLDNAIKYSGTADSIVVGIESKDSFVRISVKDNGIGIKRDDLERIFDKFYRVSDNLVHNVKGSGLGLSIARQIIEAHGGMITVASEIGRGSTFTIHLPYAKEVANAPSSHR
jgi:signal transduction histidine kinase